MIRHRSTESDLDPAVAAELEALEAALAGEPSADPELSALVREVRAQAPSMPLALRERLDADVAAGFPKAKRAGFDWPKLVRRGLPVLAGAAVLAVIAGGALRGGTDGGSPSVGSSTALSAVAPEAATSAPSADSAAPAQINGTEATVTSRDTEKAAAVPPAQRKVERDVQLALTVDPGTLQDAADGVVRTTQGVGGYVADSQVSAQGRGGDATFTLRVPTANLDRAIAALSKLGHVASIDQSSQDITSSFVSVGAKLSDARAERKALVRALAKATTASEIAALRDRIAQNRATTAALTAQLNRLRGRADLATIAMTVHAPRTAVAAPPSRSGWTPGDAAHDALRVLQVTAGVAIVSAAVLVPLALLGLLGGLAGRGVRRRRREGALDG